MPANLMRAQRSATIVASAASSSSASSSSAPTPQNRGRIIVPVAKKLVGPSGAPLRGASAAASAVVAPDRAAPKDGPLVLNGQVSTLVPGNQGGLRKEEREEAFAKRKLGNCASVCRRRDHATAPAKRTRAVDFVAARSRPLLVPVSLFRPPASPGNSTRRVLLRREEPRAFPASAGATPIILLRSKGRRFFSSFVPSLSRSLAQPPPLPPCPFSSLPFPPSQTKKRKKKTQNPRHQVLHSITAERLEIVRSIDDHIENQVYPILKDSEACWQPADFLPDSSSPDFVDEVRELRKRTDQLPDDYFVVLVGDMITEEALPTYMAMLNTLDGVRDETGAAPTPWARWTRAWTAEENRHGDLMNKYCYLSGRVNMKAVELTIQNLITSGMDPKTENNPYYGFIYT